MRRRVPRPDGSSSLTDREEEIARRVRRALHLSASMPEEEVAQQFRGSVAWRRARMGIMGEEIRDGVTEALRPALSRMRTRLCALVRRIRALWAQFGN